VEQAQGHQPASKPASNDDLADRLDRLGMPVAERVLRRAIELQDESASQKDQISLAALQQVAAELGIEPEQVRRALAEELTAASEPISGLLGKVLAPASLSQRRVIEGSAEQVEAAVRTWMIDQEGLRLRLRSGTRTSWEKEGNPAIRIRQGLKMTRGSGALRSVPEVVSQHSRIDDGSQVVELKVDTAVVNRTAVGVGSGLGAAGVAAGVAAAMVSAGGNDMLQFLSGFAPFVVLAGVGAILTARVWTATLRQGIARAIDGIQQELTNPSPRPARSLINEIVRMWTDRR
jgi:hypothetical protein